MRTKGPSPRTTRNYKRILGNAGVPIEAFHSLRKSGITHWLEGGVPPHEVQAMAGHASIETMMKYYAKVDKSAIAGVRDVTGR